MRSKYANMCVKVKKMRIKNRVGVGARACVCMRVCVFISSIIDL